MKKILFLSLLGLPVLFLWGCSLINTNNWIEKGENQQIYESNQVLNWLNEEVGIEKIYSMRDWIMYLNWNIMYWTNLKSYDFCTTNLENKCKYGIEIIAENNNYLLFTAIESFNWEYYLSYLLDKTTNIAKSFELWDKLYTFDYKNWDDININVYDGWILWWNGAIRSKWYFNNFNCDECGITKTWTIQVNLNNLINYTTNQNHILIP
jgi:hypothetical protein